MTSVAAGLGYTAPAVVGAGLSAAGIGVLAVSFGLERRDRRRVAPDEPERQAA